MGNDSKALQLLKDALAAMKEAKPEERGDLSRSYAVAITELEKLIAYYIVFVDGERIF